MHADIMYSITETLIHPATIQNWSTNNKPTRTNAYQSSGPSALLALPTLALVALLLPCLVAVRAQGALVAPAVVPADWSAHQLSLAPSYYLLDLLAAPAFAFAAPAAGFAGLHPQAPDAPAVLGSPLLPHWTACVADVAAPALLLLPVLVLQLLLLCHH